MTSQQGNSTGFGGFGLLFPISLIIPLLWWLAAIIVVIVLVGWISQSKTRIWVSVGIVVLLIVIAAVGLSSLSHVNDMNNCSTAASGYGC